MITFTSPELADRQWIQPLLEAEGDMGCEYTFANLYLWNRAYAQQIACLDDRLLVRVEGRLGPAYLYPSGRGELVPALDLLAEDAAAQGRSLTLVCVSQSQQAAIEAVCPGRFAWQDDRDGYDYLYDVGRLAQLTGKKLHGKRNHIHRFDRQFPDWLAEAITPSNVPDCVELERRWAIDHRGEGAGENTLSEETAAVIEALYHMEELGLEGLLIRAGGSVVAFTLGGFITPTCFDVNFEKALAHVQGAYTVVNREMARLVQERHPSVKYLNREDDLGLEGLRKSKLSYYPDLLLAKYTGQEICP